MRATLPEKSVIKVDRLLTHSEGMAMEKSLTELPPMRFANRFEDVMAMNADVSTVASYLDRHGDWFTRCAQPMKVEPIHANGYAITIGTFKSTGYVIEPKVGLELLPQDQGVYCIRTIDLPGDPAAMPYTVDFSAEMRLLESGSAATQVAWHLDLAVTIQFPKFIYKLPRSVLQGTGDKVLQQIVRQVSKRLTQKVQKDFHSNAGLALP